MVGEFIHRAASESRTPEISGLPQAGPPHHIVGPDSRARLADPIDGDVPKVTYHQSRYDTKRQRDRIDLVPATQVDRSGEAVGDEESDVAGADDAAGDKESRPAWQSRQNDTFAPGTSQLRTMRAVLISDRHDTQAAMTPSAMFTRRRARQVARTAIASINCQSASRDLGRAMTARRSRISVMGKAADHPGSAARGAGPLDRLVSRQGLDGGWNNPTTADSTRPRRERGYPRTSP